MRLVPAQWAWLPAAWLCIWLALRKLPLVLTSGCGHVAQLRSGTACGQDQLLGSGVSRKHRHCIYMLEWWRENSVFFSLR